MIAFDTNVLVRLLVKDDPKQFAAASRRLLEADGPCYLSDAVLCEAAWVLRSRYGASRSDLLIAMSQIVEDPKFLVDEPSGILQALAVFKEGKADFSDYLIAARARQRGAITIYTFDRKLAKSDGCTLLT